MREAIVVLGMHRSGTSMVSGILKLTGLDLGKNLWNPDHANAKGYFENSQIGIFNDNLFDLMHRNWYDTLLLPDQWWLDPKISCQTDRFAEIIRDQFDANSFLLFKDPRISILIPFYLVVFDKLNIKPYFIINFRDPFQVAASLKKRNNLAISKSLILWLDHTLKAELYTRHQQRIFIHYDKVLDDPVLFLKNLFLHFNLEYSPPPVHVKRILDFVEKDLNHQCGQIIPQNIKIPVEVNQLFELLCSLHGMDINSPVRKKLDMIGTRFYSNFRFFQGIDDRFEAMLQIESTSHKRKTSLLPILIGPNCLDFPVDWNTPVARIILNPCNQRTGVIINKTVITTHTHEQFEINPNYSNAEWSDPDGALVFESETPEITYILEHPTVLDKIFFDLTYIVNATPTYRFGIDERNQFIKRISTEKTEYQEQVKNDQQEIDALNNKVLAGFNEISDLKTYHSQKEEEYHQVISLCHKEMETISALSAKNEDAYRVSLESKQNEISSLAETIVKIESFYKEAIKSIQDERERVISQMIKNDSLNNLVIESKQSEIQNVREELKQTIEASQQEVSRLNNEIRKQGDDFSGIIDGLNQKMSDASRIYEREMTYAKSLIAEKEKEISVIFNSYTWKAGKFILAPAQILLKKKDGG